MKVLVAIDIINPVKPIIDEVIALMPLERAEVLFLYVKEEFPSYERVLSAAGDFQDDWGHQVEAKAKAAFDEAATLMKPHCGRVSNEIVVGPPAAMIETVARDEKFDVTVVTPGRHSRVEMFFLGSTSSRVVKSAAGTSLICRPKNGASTQPQKVIMGIDGSEQSHYAVAMAAEQFRLSANGTEVILVHIVNVADVFKMISPIEYISMVENNLLMEGETFLADGKRILADHGVKKVSVVLKEGDPATEIVNVANSSAADLVVIGAQGRTPVEHFIGGEISQRVAMRSPCSTAVIKSPAKPKP